jgi:hypothetical protein
MNKYMVILHGKPSEWKKFPKEQQDQLIQKYMSWVEQLKVENRFKGGSELHPVHREILTGYFIITAKSLDEAVDVSKGCPALTHGDWVQVYEMPNRE